MSLWIWFLLGIGWGIGLGCLIVCIVILEKQNKKSIENRKKLK